MRRPRIHRAGELYYLVGRGKDGRTVLSGPDDYADLQAAFASFVREGHGTIYAFCLEPNSFHIAVRTNRVTSSQLMSSVQRRYVESHHRRWRSRGPLFAAHHKALLVDDAYLAELVRFVHWTAVRTSCAHDLTEWPYSSHPVYVGSRTLSWVDTCTMLHGWDARLEVARARYGAFMAVPPDEFYTRGFTHGLPREPRVFGSAAFLRRIGLDVSPALSRSVEEAARSICFYCGVTEDELRSDRRLAWARALAAWYVEQRGIGRIAEVARHFGRHGSTLRSAIKLHQARSSERFDVDAIRRARPILPIPSGVVASFQAEEPPSSWWQSAASTECHRALCIEQQPIPSNSRRCRRRGHEE